MADGRPLWRSGPDVALVPYGGSIELITAPMFCGKSTELIRRVRRNAAAGLSSVIVKFAKDVRYGTGDLVVTHAGDQQGSTPGDDFCAPIRVVQACRLADVDVLGDGVVGIDEGQFFPDLIEYCERWANEGRLVIVAALDATFERLPFGEVCALAARCELVTKYQGVCMRCRQRPSSFSVRLGDSKEVIEVGGHDAYRSVCRACYHATSAPPRVEELG